MTRKGEQPAVWEEVNSRRNWAAEHRGNALGHAEGGDMKAAARSDALANLQEALAVHRVQREVRQIGGNDIIVDADAGMLIPGDSATVGESTGLEGQDPSPTPHE